MAETLSTMMPLGTNAPDFRLPDTLSDKEISLGELRSDIATLIMFICNHCPFVKHIQTELVRLAQDYQPKGITLVAISSNDVVNYPQDHPQEMKKTARAFGYSFPYLYDESQEVARAYQAVCTPDFFIFDGGLRCVYRGQLDDSRPSNHIPVSGRDVRAAFDALLNGTEVSSQQLPSVGCSIKWKR